MATRSYYFETRYVPKHLSSLVYGWTQTLKAPLFEGGAHICNPDVPELETPAYLIPNPFETPPLLLRQAMCLRESTLSSNAGRGTFFHSAQRSQRNNS